MKRLILLAMAISISQPALSLNREVILDLVSRATVITRASKLCPQYEFNVDLYRPTISRARELIGEKAVNNKIDSVNDVIKDALVRGLKANFCDMAKNSDAEMESYLK